MFNKISNGTAAKMHEKLEIVDKVKSFTRRDDIAELLKEGGVGIELGVAEAWFSNRILERSNLAYLYSVDMYAGDRGHDVAQYQRAFRVLDKHRERNSLIKMRFDEALALFPDNYFDFIYVDGYAHTGEEGGKTFYDWWPKLKAGGIFAGDDYDREKWPQVAKAVDAFLSSVEHPLHLIETSEQARSENAWSRFPTWLTLKKPPVVIGRHDETTASTISFVGNGPIDPSLGPIIDSADLVVRFNTAKHIEAAGTKTDVLALINHGVHGENLSTPGAVHEAAANSARRFWLAQEPSVIEAKLARGVETKDWTAELIKNVIRDRDIVFLSEGLGARTRETLSKFGDVSGKAPSSGALAMMHLLSKNSHAKINVFGFTHKGWAGHPWDAEREWFSSLEESGRVKRY